MTICPHKNLAKGPKSLTLILNSKSMDYLQFTSFIVIKNDISLLGSIINKIYKQVVVVQEKMPSKKLICVINKSP